jgi:hypothetical protein
MPGYVKLDKSITDSSLWQESNETKLLWITLLTMTDANGEVRTSLPGLARRAGVTVEQAKEALRVLASPDPNDRSGVAEGRRIVEIDHGWEVINYNSYTQLANSETVKAQTRERVRRHRERKKGVTVKRYTPLQSVTGVTSNGSNGTETETETETDEQGTPPLSSPVGEEHGKKKSAKAKAPKEKHQRHVIPPVYEVVREYGRQRGMADPDINVFFDYWESVGWKRGSRLIKDWEATLRVWQSRTPPKPQTHSKTLTSVEAAQYALTQKAGEAELEQLRKDGLIK